MFLCIHAKAQQNELLLLSEYLSVTEDDFDIYFSYADDDLENLHLPAIFFEDINQRLKHIQNFSYFEISQVSDRIYTLVANEKLTDIDIQVLELATNQPVDSFTLSIKNLIFKVTNQHQISLKFPVSFQNSNLLIDAKNFQVNKIKLSEIKTNKLNTLYLEIKAEELKSILISNYIASGINKLENGNEEIRVSKFKSFPGLVEADVLQNIQILPGINSTQESLSYLNIRGGTHDQNLFLWDGIKMYQTSHFFGMISAFSPYMIESTEISKNATSAQYFDGVSGMVEMKTSNLVSSVSRTEVGFNLINADVFTNQPINSTSSIQVSSRHSLNFALNTPTYNSFYDKVFQNTVFENAQHTSSAESHTFNFFDTAIRYLNQVTEKDKIRINLVYHQNNFELSQHDAFLPATTELGSQLQQSNWSGGFNWQRRWNENHESNIQFGISNYNLEGLNSAFSQEQSLFQANEVRDWNFNWQHSQKWTDKLAITYGIQLNETGVINKEEFENPFFLSEERKSILVSGAYGGLEFLSKDEMSKLYLGGRLNHFSQFNSVSFEPRLYFRQKFLNHFTFELSTEQKSQVTTQLVDLQTDFLGVENRRWVVADPNQRPILQSQQFEAAFQFFKNNWLVSLAGYVKSVEGIGTQSQGFVNQFQFTEDFGEYNVLGLDFLINKQLRKTSMWMSYSFMDNTYNFDSLTPNEFPNNTNITHIINAGVQHQLGDFDFSIGASWHSGVPFTGIQTQQAQGTSIPFEHPNQSVLPNYFRLDASVNYKVELTSKMKLKSGLSFWNITDRKNIYNSFYENNQQLGTIENFQQLGLGFTPNFMIRLIF